MKKLEPTQYSLRAMKSMARNIARLDKQGLSTPELRFQVYKMGLYYYREIHRAGPVMDLMDPSLLSEALVWDKQVHKYVRECDLTPTAEPAVA